MRKRINNNNKVIRNTNTSSSSAGTSSRQGNQRKLNDQKNSNERQTDEMGGLKKVYGPAKIDIIHKQKDDQSGYKNHPVNKMIQ